MEMRVKANTRRRSLIQARSLSERHLMEVKIMQHYENVSQIEFYPSYFVLNILCYQKRIEIVKHFHISMSCIQMTSHNIHRLVGYSGGRFDIK